MQRDAASEVAGYGDHDQLAAYLDLGVFFFNAFASEWNGVVIDSTPNMECGSAPFKGRAACSLRSSQLRIWCGVQRFFEFGLTANHIFMRARFLAA